MTDDQAEPAHDAGADADGEASAPKKTSKKRTIIGGVVSVIVMVVVFWLLIPQFASYTDAFSDLANVSWEWIAALVVAGVVNIAFYPVTMMAAVHGLKYWPAFVVRQSMFLIANVIPGGGAVAIGTQYEQLVHYRVKSIRAAAAVSAESIYTYMTTLAFPAIAVGILFLRGQHLDEFAVSTALIATIIVVVGCVGIIAVLHSNSGARRLGRIGERALKPAMERLHKPTPDLQAELVSFRGDTQELMRTKWLGLLITNVVAQLTPFAILVVALAALGAFPDHVSIFAIFAAYSVAMVLTTFPNTPGGLGTIDAALIALLTAFGTPASVAVAADLVWRIVWFFPQLFVGAGAMGTYMVARNRRRRAAGAATTTASASAADANTSVNDAKKATVQSDTDTNSEQPTEETGATPQSPRPPRGGTPSPDPPDPEN